MAVKIICPSCQGSFERRGGECGEETTCPHCDRRFHIELEGSLTARPVAAPPMATTGRIRFTFSCARCSSILEAHDGICGQKGRCPTCGGVFTVPQVDRHTGIALESALIAEDGQLPTPMHAYATAGSKAPMIIRRADGSQAVRCPRCGREMPVESDTCRACGMPFTMEGAQEIMSHGPETNSLASASLTVGVLSIPTFCLQALGPVAISLGFVAIQRASKMGSNMPGRTMAIAGILCGLAGCGVFIASLIIKL